MLMVAPAGAGGLAGDEGAADHHDCD